MGLNHHAHTGAFVAKLGIKKEGTFQFKKKHKKQNNDIYI